MKLREAMVDSVQPETKRVSYIANDEVTYELHDVQLEERVRKLELHINCLQSVVDMLQQQKQEENKYVTVLGE